MTSTNWTNTTSNTTGWSNVSGNSTSFSGREVINLGATADSALYLADDTVLTADDRKLQSFVAPATTWT